jgi:hypothetical protein
MITRIRRENRDVIEIGLDSGLYPDNAFYQNLSGADQFSGLFPGGSPSFLDNKLVEPFHLFVRIRPAKPATIP